MSIVKIAIDARLYRQTGVGVYLRNLIANLKDQAPTNFHFYIYVLPQDAHLVPQTKNISVKICHARWHTWNEQLSFLFELWQKQYDLVHFTYFSYPVLYSGRYIATVHDLTPWHYPTGRASSLPKLLYWLKYHMFRFVLTRQVAGARDIIAPSQTVKQDLIQTLGHQYESKTQVVYEGLDVEFTSHLAQLTSQEKRAHYLYVGNFYPHKNVSRLLQAWVQIPHRLILAGPKDFYHDKIQTQIKQLNLSGRVEIITKPDEIAKVKLYQSAIALVHPSLSEGFGLTLVEAMACGLPIFASDTPIFHEILGEQGYFFNPHNLESIINAIKNAPPLKYGLSQYSDNLKRFSFTRHAEIMIKIYQHALDS